jgi:hypothetical protein
MTRMVNINSVRHQSAKLATGLAISALILLGTSLAMVDAQEYHNGHGGWNNHRDWRGGPGYYVAPPVVYAAPYFAPPPVVYGPAIGIYMPGVSIGIH